MDATRDILEQEATTIILQHLNASPEYFVVDGKYVVELEMLKYLLSNWKIRYQCLGDLEDFLVSRQEFRMLQDSAGTSLIRERSGGMAQGSLTTTEIYCSEENIQNIPATRLGIRIEDLFQLPAPDSEVELAYQLSLENTRKDLHHLLNTSKLMKGIFKNHGSPKFERLEWLGDAVLNLELTIILLTELSPFHYAQSLKLSDSKEPSSLEKLRRAAERNFTLALLYEELQIVELTAVRGRADFQYYDFKMKGDIMEALLGELYMTLQCNNEQTEGLQSILTNILPNILGLSLYRSRFLLPQDEITNRIRMADLPGGGGIRSSQEPVLSDLPSLDDEINPPPPELLEEPKWKLEVSNYWKQVILKRFVDTLGTDMISMKNISEYFQNDWQFHRDHPEVSQKDYTSAIFRACCADEENRFHIVRNGREFWPYDRDIYSSVKCVPGYRKISKEDWFVERVQGWVSEIILTFIKSKGLKPFYLRKLLLRISEKSFSIPTGLTSSDYFRLLESALRHHPSVIYEYRQFRSEDTNLPQGPCFWPIIHLTREIRLTGEPYYLPKGDLSMWTINLHSVPCPKCGKYLPVGGRIPNWYHIEEGDATYDNDSWFCHDCFCLKLTSFVMELIQIKRKKLPKLFSFHSLNKKEIDVAIKTIGDKIGFHQLIFRYLGSGTQLLLNIIKQTIEKDAITEATACLGGNNNHHKSLLLDGKSVMEIKQLGKIMKWIERYQYLGDMESFFVTNDQIFRVFEDKETGMKLIREKSANIKLLNDNDDENELNDEIDVCLTGEGEGKGAGEGEKEAKEEEGGEGDGEAKSVSEKKEEEIKNTTSSLYFSSYENLVEAHQQYFNFHSFTSYDLRTGQYLNSLSNEEIEFRSKISLFQVEIERIFQELSDNEYLMRVLSKIESNECQLLEDLGKVVLHFELTHYLYSLQSVPPWYYSSNPSLSSSPSKTSSSSNRPSPGTLTSLRNGLESSHLLSFLVDELNLFKYCHQYHLFQNLIPSPSPCSSSSSFSSSSWDTDENSSKIIKNKLFRQIVGVIYHWIYISPSLDDEATSMKIPHSDDSYLSQHGHEFIGKLIGLLAYRSKYLLPKYYK